MGISASSGIGIGKAIIIKSKEAVYEQVSNLSENDEMTRIMAALDEYREKTEKSAEKIRRELGEKDAEILLGHIEIVGDPTLSRDVENEIHEGKTAESAVEHTLERYAAIFEGTGDELTMQRAADLRDIKTRLIGILCGIDEVDLESLPPDTVIVTHDLTPSITAGLNHENVVGIVTEVGGRTSHFAILARSLGIPAVSGISGITDTVIDGDTIIVDGLGGGVIQNPNETELKQFKHKKDDYTLKLEGLKQLKNVPAQTADGHSVRIFCNIGGPNDCAAVLENGGEGVGLFRTEFLYMERPSMPSENEQLSEYKSAALAVKGKPVVIRTLDIGGDKNIPYLRIKREDNPFMGFRAIRYCLKNTVLFKCQIRAILRASAFGNVRIMLPLVTCVEEIRAAKELVEIAKRELSLENIEYDKNIKVGVMIETPAAAMTADLLAKEADFFSIGTNDLIGYTMAVDRTNAEVAYLYSPCNISVLRSIKRIIRCAKDAGIPVGMCGEAAADMHMIPLLLSFGLDEFSVSPTSVLEVKDRISRLNMSDANAIAEKVMKCSTESKVKRILAAQ